MRASRKGAARQLGALLLPLLAGCVRSGADGERACEVLGSSVALPPEIRESSGVAVSRARPGLYWMHNDQGGKPDVYAVDAEGRLRQRVRLVGARNEDWEDVALGPCPAGECLYLADIGDNRARRGEVVIYRIPEPRAADTALRAERFPARYPGGAGRDAEALFVLPDTSVYILTKGREAPVALFRYPGSLRAGEVVELEHLRDLTPGPLPHADRVTAAAASPSGRWVAVRTYSTLMIFRREELLRSPGRPRALTTDLTTLGEPQGEGVALGDDGLVVLTSEGGSKHAPATLMRLRCALW